ncbi:MAG: hypothetical protein JSW33_00975 [bacterium]|nr:MAG: hypothetical protein JSW33_00975 [bacterium]
MKHSLPFHVVLFLCVICMVTCENVSDPLNDGNEWGGQGFAKPGSPQMATGTVEVIWKGGQGNMGGQQSDPKLAFADFNALAEYNGNPAKGEFIYRVLNSDLTLHREVFVLVENVYVNENQSKAWFSGEVISDSRGCSGNGGGGHSGGCSGGGGCGGGHTTPSGGCSGHDGGHDSGCSGDDGGDHSTGCPGSGGSGGPGSPGGSGGNGGQGAQCRVGQILAAKVHDVGTPGTNGDGITWKWFDADDPNVPAPADETTVGTWPHLCKKTIIAGNLVVHF